MKLMHFVKFVYDLCDQQVKQLQQYTIQEFLHFRYILFTGLGDTCPPQIIGAPPPPGAPTKELAKCGPPGRSVVVFSCGGGGGGGGIL